MISRPRPITELISRASFKDPLYDEAASRLDINPKLTGVGFVEQILDEARLFLRAYSADADHEEHAYESIGSTPRALGEIYGIGEVAQDAVCHLLHTSPLFNLIGLGIQAGADADNLLLETAYAARRAFRVAWIQSRELNSKERNVGGNGCTDSGDILPSDFILDTNVLSSPFEDETISSVIDDTRVISVAVIPCHPMYNPVARFRPINDDPRLLEQEYKMRLN